MLNEAANNSNPSLLDGTVYSGRKNFCPFSVPPLEAYTHIVTSEKIERLQKIAERLKGLKLLELNATAEGGGVAEMLYSTIPFMNRLGIEAEWKVIRGSREYFESTKSLHNLLQGMKGTFTPEMERIYCHTIAQCATGGIIDYHPDVVVVHDPQPVGLSHHLKRSGQTWIWRCHIDIEEPTLQASQSLQDFISDWLAHYDAAIFSAAHYVITHWRLPKFIIPPFIDPLSEKNRELSREEVEKVLCKYHIDPKIPLIVQIGRFDPWKGLDRTIATFRLVRKQRKCQLILAGGLASDDPEGERILARIYQETKDEEDIHLLNLSLSNRLENWFEVNALQRAANVIMQPSTKEGFGLVITEALWKGKPVITADVGAIPLQVKDGDTGYFYQSPQKTARRLNYLLDNPDAAEELGRRGKQYVTEHFLMPDRIVDWLLAINMLVNGHLKKEISTECIISFHPWHKLSKRRQNRSTATTS